MAAHDREIDGLYQLALAEFTPARDALAKRAGKDAPAIKKLQKPNAPAWAVNQLYWRGRDLFDRLVDAADRLRAEHGRLLTGAKADIARAEAAHAEAAKAATDQARAILREAGETPSPATLAAVSETLRALRRGAVHGRLTRPLKLSGFEALDGLVRAAPVAHRPSTSAITLTDRRPRKTDQRAEKARARDVAALREERRTAAADARAAQSALARTKEALAAAERTRVQLEAEVDASVARVKQLRTATAQQEQQVAATHAALARIEMRLGALTSATE